MKCRCGAIYRINNPFGKHSRTRRINIVKPHKDDCKYKNEL